jgi:hypothetical protein
MHPTDFYQSPAQQGPVGRSPNQYLDELPQAHLLAANSLVVLPSKGANPLTRAQVRAISRNPEVAPLVAYACIMAWGGRDFGNYRRSLLNNGIAIARLVESLRASTATRAEDFTATRKAADEIPGLGISFYTKLLFFLRGKPDAYILDQWTAKSATVLFPDTKIGLTASGLPDPNTTADQYEAFCKNLETCCGIQGWGEAWKTGEDVEMTIFDRPRGSWRTWLKMHLGDGLDRSAGRNKTRTSKQKPKNQKEDTTVLRFAGQLRSAYLNAQDQGLSLPETCGKFNTPNRLYVRKQDGFIFQFILNRNDVRAQMFLRGKATNTYSRLLNMLRPSVTGKIHDFGEGITGNGPENGKTRAVNLYASALGGWAGPVDQWPGICVSAVEAMAELVGFVEPHLQKM